jgi:hypothetical protein
MNQSITNYFHNWNQKLAIDMDDDLTRFFNELESTVFVKKDRRRARYQKYPQNEFSKEVTETYKKYNCNETDLKDTNSKDIMCY